jgi:phenylalanyl-tRNA synthetase beta chain
MRISINWLQELVSLKLSPEALAETLTIAGLEVEEIEDRRSLAQGVVVGKIVKRQPHPNADKLSVCQVDIGQKEPLNIVCGAPNARENIYVPVATLGTYLPAIDLKIKSAKLRGVKSEGMICSLAELGLTKESEGIHEFSKEEVAIGQEVSPLLGLDDVILDLTPTANRADAMSMVGVAREVAALTGSALKLPEISPITWPSSKELALKIADSRACPAYFGTVIEGVKIAPSPQWLQRRLAAAGVRPINNVVDVTNLVLLEWGQPLHAFDRDRLQTLAGSQAVTIGVRFAREGETLQTLDGQERSLKPENLLITANDRPCALAGVMGGQATEIHPGTQNLILEAALFDNLAIRRSSRSQSLRSESSARYERGINQSELEIACQRAISLIIELAGGAVVSQTIADTRTESDRQSIQLRLSRLQQVLGPVKEGEITAEVVERILRDLGCQLTAGKTPGNWLVSVPSYRYRDLEREIDLIEEVARLYGYDRFCDELPDKTEPGGLSWQYQAERRIREVFRAAGLTEVVQYSLVKPEGEEVVLANPLFAEYSALRTNLLDGLIAAAATNWAAGNGALNAVEIGRVFAKDGGEIAENDAIAGIFGGDFFPQGRWVRGGKPSPMSWYEAKGLLESALQRLGLSVKWQPDSKDNRLHPGRTASLWLAGELLGSFGQLHPQLRQQRDLPDATYTFEMNLTALVAALTETSLQVPRFRHYSSYPAVARDLAFFAPLSVSVAQLAEAMRGAGGQLLDEVELFDEYRGQNVAAGSRSLAFSLSYRAGDRTLTDAEVDPVHDQIREALVQQFAVVLRS